MNKPSLSKVACILFVFCAATAIASPAQVLTTLHSFDSSDGAYPDRGVIQTSDATFYGTTPWRGAGCWGDGCGTVFKMTPNGTLTTLHLFDYSDGAHPTGLILASDGGFYGTTYEGGANDFGTVFAMAPDGELFPLYSFCSQPQCLDGEYPTDGLIQANDGTFYGTTSYGGTYQGCYGQGCGTVFQITPAGALTTVHLFVCNEGGGPSGLVQASDGNFYGTTAYCGGAYGYGTVFKMTPTGTLTLLHSFNGSDGDSGNGLVQASDGNFYGTTYSGGAYCEPCGTVFRITPSGSLTVLHSFNGTDGASPSSALIQASDGNFYGTTYAGGASGNCSGVWHDLQNHPERNADYTAHLRRH